jgi:DNA-binding SARP family transcriptional activator
MKWKETTMTKAITFKPPEQVWFQLFGPVTAYADGREVPMGGQKERCLLAVLLLAKGKRVSRARLAQWLWDDADKPAQAIYEVVSAVRGHLRLAGLGQKLVNKGGMYELDIDPNNVDIHRFNSLTNPSPEVDDEHRQRMLGEALRLPVGEPLADLDGLMVESFRDQLSRKFRDTEIRYHQIDVRHGRHLDRIPDLDRLFRAAPEDARIAGLYMYALHQANRAVDALDVYAAHRNRLAASGIDPDQKLKDLQVSILRNEPDLSQHANTFLGGTPATAPRSSTVDDEPEAETDAPEPETPQPVGPRAKTVFNGPVTTSGNTVFGIQLGGAP